MPINTAPVKISDKSLLPDTLAATDRVFGWRPGEPDASKRNKQWSAQQVADFVKSQLSLSQAIALADAQALTPVAGRQYAITGAWNAGSASQVVILFGTASGWAPTGWLGSNLVSVNVAAGTALGIISPAVLQDNSARATLDVALATTGRFIALNAAASVLVSNTKAPSAGASLIEGRNNSIAVAAGIVWSIRGTIREARFTGAGIVSLDNNSATAPTTLANVPTLERCTGSIVVQVPASRVGAVRYGAFVTLQVDGTAYVYGNANITNLKGAGTVHLYDSVTIGTPNATGGTDGGTDLSGGLVVVDHRLSSGPGYDDTALKARLGQTTAADPAAPVSLVSAANIKATATAYYNSLSDGSLRGFTSVDAALAAYHQESLDTGGLAPAAESYAININNAPAAMRAISASYVGDAFRLYGTTNNPISLAIAAGKTVSVNTCRYVSFTQGAIKPYMDRAVTLTNGRTDNLELEFLSGSGALTLDSYNVAAWTNPTGKAVSVTLTGTSTVPAAPAGVTVVDNTVVTKPAGGNGGPAYTAGTGITLAGSTISTKFTYAALRYETATKLTLDQYRYGIPLTLVLPNSNAALAAGGGYFTIPADGFYGIKGHVHMVFPDTTVYAEALIYTNGDFHNIIAFSEIVPRDVGGGLYLGSEPIATDVYLTAGTTVHLGYVDGTGGSMYPRSDAPANSCKLSIIRFA